MYLNKALQTYLACVAWCGIGRQELMSAIPTILLCNLCSFCSALCLINVMTLTLTFSREPLKVMLYDTHSSDDVNINEEIARVLSSEGLTIDFTLFTPTSDSASEGSRASSPPPTTSTTTVDQLQQTAENLTLRDKTDAPTADSSAQKDSAVAVPSNVDTPKPAAVVRTVSGSDTEAIASQSAGVAPPGGVGSSPYSDSLCVTYDTWPLPSYVPHPEEGQFFDVFVYSVSDPSNFVVSESCVSTIPSLFFPPMLMPFDFQNNYFVSS